MEKEKPMNEKLAAKRHAEQPTVEQAETTRNAETETTSEAKAEFHPIDEPYGVVTHTQKELRGWLDQDVRTVRTADRRTYTISHGTLENLTLCLKEILPSGMLGPPTMTTAVIMSMRTGPNPIGETMPTWDEAMKMSDAHGLEPTSLDPTTERLSERVNTQTVRKMLLAQANETQKVLARYRSQVKDLASKNEDLQQEILTARESEEDALRLIRESNEERNHLKRELRQARQDADGVTIQSLKEQLRSVMNQRAELAKDLAAMTTARDEAIQEVILARTQRDEVARDLMLQTKEMDEARAKWIEVGKQRDALMCTGGEMADMRKERDELRKRLQSKSGLGQAFEAVAKSEGELKDKNAAQAEEIARLTLRCVELHNPKLVAEMNVKLQATKLDRDELAHELSHLRTSFAEETERRMRTEGTVAELEEESTRMKQEIRELKKMEDGLSERLALTSKDLAMWRERARAAESAVTDLDAETVRLKRELRETQEDRDKMAAELRAYHGNVMDMDAITMGLQRDLLELRETRETAISEARKERDRAIWERKRMQDALDLQTKRVGELEMEPVPDEEKEQVPKLPNWTKDMMESPMLKPTPPQPIGMAVELMRQASRVTAFAAQLMQLATKDV